MLGPDPHLRIHLRGRFGLEPFVRDEVVERMSGKLRVTESEPGCVAVVPLGPFSLAEIYAMRCFGSVCFVLGKVEAVSDAKSIDALADVIASPQTRRILETFTEGAIRYRLNFVAKGHQRAAVERLAAQVYARCPEILNDGRSVTWTIDIHPKERGQWVE